MRLPVAAFAACLAVPALADQPARCAPRAVQMEVLTTRFGEAPLVIGLSQVGVVEMWGNPNTGTWTVTVTAPDGTMCGMIAGLALDIRPAPKPGVDG